MRNRKWLKRASPSTFRFLRWCLLLGFCTLFYAKSIEPNWISINSLQLTLPHLASEFHGYRIVQVSDIHRDRWMNPQRIRRIVDLVNQQEPDLVAITGDLITRHLPQFIPSLGSTLGQFMPKDLTVATLGNHDHENDVQAIIQVIEQSGIVHLGNDVYTLKRGQGILHIAGVDDVGMGKDRLDLVLQKLPPGGAAVLLAHEPDFALSSATTGRFDLQLSGHSHGGQVRLPFLKPPILPPWGKRYYLGLYQVGDMQLYTNRGLGMTGLHLRFFARPEITVFTLVAPGFD
ncbi:MULTISPECIES: metallophosphoesterase [unclassified Nodularia (in: cyanobacteria)]|uniref:metallophosphoesterase n=1 Tax=unclassified Nodularia (in: cyanobacteria) TaxID=2656917 RepID=UPI0018805BB8|nr:MULTISPECIES: metallophosphoesterase [unclassified Nodularia (in: cyanobacteria)]MBE9200818.1 metallophosphoesterase [Nodularia sp. LEGE 06071]MCC2693800.1 metallophosphoesterase [Nodularia sp. LEGE 04288]